MSRREAFTLIELLVVVAIIAIIAALLLPSLGAAKSSSLRTACSSNARQITLAATAYAFDNNDWMNPLQDVRKASGSGPAETTYRVVLWSYAGRSPNVFDCPAEPFAVYADGISEADAAQGGFALKSGVDWPHLYGFASPYEVWNASGIGVAGAHWIPAKDAPDPFSRVSTMPFGRPKNQGYYEGLHRMSEISSPAKMLWFGDGGSGTAAWGDDNWWIKDMVPGLEDSPGFNRLAQDDYGSRRHAGKANYAFADGHTGLYNANDLRCDQQECWWSIQLNAHSIKISAATQ